MSDPRGLHDKFRVSRTDGRDCPGMRHHGCRYFVLDLDHDPHAWAAIREYIDVASEDRPRLTADLALMVAERQAERGEEADDG